MDRKNGQWAVCATNGTTNNHRWNAATTAAAASVVAVSKSQQLMKTLAHILSNSIEGE